MKRIVFAVALLCISLSSTAALAKSRSGRTGVGEEQGKNRGREQGT